MFRHGRIGAVVVISLALALAAGASFLSAHAGAATTAPAATPKVSTASATLKAKTGSARGAFTARISSAKSTSGTLAWKLTYKGLSGKATGVQLRQGAKVLARLCTGTCASGVHKTAALHGATFHTVSTGKATVTVSTKAHPTGEIVGTLKVKGASSGGGGGGGGGGLTVKVTPAAIAAGKKLADQFGCTGCHTITGAKSTGPTWKGLAGSKVHLTTGKTITATDSYLVGVITDPSTLQVAGYDSGVMSEVIAPGAVSDAQARNIVAYIKSLK